MVLNERQRSDQRHLESERGYEKELILTKLGQGVVVDDTIFLQYVPSDVKSFQMPSFLRIVTKREVQIGAWDAVVQRKSRRNRNGGTNYLIDLNLDTVNGELTFDIEGYTVSSVIDGEDFGPVREVKLKISSDKKIEIKRTSFDERFGRGSYQKFS